MSDIEDKAQLTHALPGTFQMLAEVIPQVMWTATPEGEVDYINAKWFEYSGLTAEQTRKEGCSAILHPDDLALYEEQVERALKAGKRYEMEYRIRRASDDIYRWHLRRAMPIHDGKGNIIKWVGTCIDIDDIKQAEANLRATTAQLEFALDSAGAGAWSWNISDNVVHWNKRIFMLFGEPFKDTGIVYDYETYLSKIHPDDRELSASRVQAAIAGKNNGEYTNEYRIIWPDGSIHIICTRGRAYFDEGGKATQMIGVCWDVTQQRTNEKKLRELQSELVQVTNYSVIGETASALAHELNQPLTVISTYSQLANSLLIKDNYSSTDLLNSIQQIVKQSERAGDIIHRTKDLARPRNLYLESFNINEVVREAIDFIHYEKFDLNANIQFDLKPNLSSILLDKLQIQQVIINLVNNSIEAMRNAKTFAAKIIITSNLESDNAIAVCISDNGPGISTEMRDKLFDHTFTTKPTGMGIGLTICRSIIEAHGGQLVICPVKREVGACFKFVLPLSN